MRATLQEACYENTTTVYMALELSNKQWKVLIGDGHHHRHKTVVAGDIAGLLEQIAGRVEDWRGNPLGEPLSVSGVSSFVPV